MEASTIIKLQKPTHQNEMSLIFGSEYVQAFQLQSTHTENQKGEGINGRRRW